MCAIEASHEVEHFRRRLRDVRELVGFNLFDTRLRLMACGPDPQPGIRANMIACE
jgi:hypothetical protein